jgi:transcriptional regulator with XRE-family HTH domain
VALAGTSLVRFNYRVNDRLRRVMHERGMDIQNLAETCQVDRKTVERWVSPGRRPRARQRALAAAALGAKESELWPDERSLLSDYTDRTAELVSTYPNRACVSRETWVSMLEGVEESVDILVYSGMFFAQINPHIAAVLAHRAAAGARVRLCFGDPASHAVAIRDTEEKLHGTLSAKIRASLTYYLDLLTSDGCEVRLHGATLYASLFRFDTQLLVNPHVWGQPASANPLLHLRHAEDGGWFDLYTESFEGVWKSARRLTAEEGIPLGWD